MSEMPDLSSLMSMLSNNGDKAEILSSLINSSGQNNASTQDDSSSNMPDMEMIMKMAKVMKSTSEPSPSTELLKSLKPFLNDGRKSKVDKYIKILGMTKAIDLFGELGDKK